MYSLVVYVATKRYNQVDACLDQTCMCWNYFLPSLISKHALCILILKKIVVLIQPSFSPDQNISRYHKQLRAKLPQLKPDQPRVRYGGGRYK